MDSPQHKEIKRPILPTYWRNQKKSSIEISQTSQNKTSSGQEGSGNKKSMFITTVLMMDNEVWLKSAEGVFCKKKKKKLACSATLS